MFSITNMLVYKSYSYGFAKSNDPRTLY